MATNIQTKPAPAELSFGPEPAPQYPVAVHVPRHIEDAATKGGEIDAASLFPEDAWNEVPNLEAAQQTAMLKDRTPLQVLACMYRDGDYGKMWRVIVGLESGEVYSIAFGGNEAVRNERFAKIAYLLENGAASVGPFRLTEVPTEKGNPYRSMAAISRSAAR